MKDKTTYDGETWCVTRSPYRTLVEIGFGWHTQRLAEQDLEEMLKAIREAKEESKDEFGD